MSRINYIEGFRTIQVLPEWKEDVAAAVATVLENRVEYEAIERSTGIAWPYVASIHYRESGCNFDKQILNGEPWTRKTKYVPKGHGPWESWRDAAIHVLRLHHVASDSASRLHDVENMLAKLEAWNGWGYAKRDLNSPYLWSGSQYGEGVGKFTSDGNYSETAKDKQVGAAVLVHELMSRGEWLPSVELYNLPILSDKKGLHISDRARRFQEALNLVLAGSLIQPLVVDGWIGAKTRAAFHEMTDLELHEVDL